MMKHMQARFRGTCAATGKPIRRGDEIVYDNAARKAYLKGHEPKGDSQEGADARAFQSMHDEAADRWANENL